MFSRSLTACLLACTAAVSATSLFSRTTVLRPKDDPFYDVPASIAEFSPGDIVRSRPTPGRLGGLEDFSSLNINASYQLLYRTTDALGNASAAVTTIIIPNNARFDKLVAYESAYDSSDVNCSPSYALQQASNMTGYDPLFMAAFLEQGYVLTSADYEGPHAAFVAGLQAGQATLDSIRATLASGDTTGVLADATVGIWGYSGGALASEWALELQPVYAPELALAGATLGGLTPNVTNVLEDVDNTSYSWLAFAGINGIAAAYPNVSAFLATALVPATANLFRSIDFVCSNDTAAEKNLENQDLASFFVNGAAALTEDIPASVTMWGATMGLRSTPTVPIFVYKAIGDQISPVADTDALVTKYCAAGARIQYQRNGFGDHVSEAVLGSGSAFSYLRDRLEGVAAPAGCSTQEVYVAALDPSDLEGVSAEVVGNLVALLGLPVGPLSVKGI